MISKELLSEIVRVEKLGKKINLHEFMVAGNNIKLIYKTPEYRHSFVCSIHELAFKVRDFLKEKYTFELPMNKSVKEILELATLFYEDIEKG